MTCESVACRSYFTNKSVRDVFALRDLWYLWAMCVRASMKAAKPLHIVLATNPNPTRARGYPLNINPKPDPKPDSISGPAGSGRVADLYKEIKRSLDVICNKVRIDCITQSFIMRRLSKWSMGRWTWSFNLRIICCVLMRGACSPPETTSQCASCFSGFTYISYRAHIQYVQERYIFWHLLSHLLSDSLCLWGYI